jgi:hypothetical protein
MVLEKIVKLYGAAAAAKGDTEKALAASDENAVAIRLFARAPEGECQLKLWDHHGRNPRVLEPLKPPAVIAGETQHEWRIAEPPGELDGTTLTWWIRLLSDVSTTFELRLEVLQGGKPLPDGSFSYSGPLDESEFEERDGRFHFKVA